MDDRCCISSPNHHYLNKFRFTLAPTTGLNLLRHFTFLCRLPQMKFQPSQKLFTSQFREISDQDKKMSSLKLVGHQEQLYNPPPSEKIINVTVAQNHVLINDFFVPTTPTASLPDYFQANDNRQTVTTRDRQTAVIFSCILNAPVYKKSSI